MASSVWSTVQGTVVPSSLSNAVTTSSASSSHTDPTALLHHQLASALSTVGDAQFWEETISPSTIRTSLASTDPSNPHSTPTLLRGMKWLLASISKGRDVSDFYPHVVKLVGASSLEVRKMVYVYLVQYADHDSTTRELSLLSINSFQRGLADAEPWIRALALRVLTSIRIPDILQIQILGVQTCAKDRSPYVRKCAANALAKLYSRCDSSAQRDMLLEIMIQLLEEDTATMVLTSAVIAFSELCPERLELLHNPYRKICHLLTDMDEWGQVVVLDLMARYCRKFFKKPQAWKDGTAEQIDRERRVRRTMTGIVSLEESVITNNNNSDTAAAASSLLGTESYNNNGDASTITPKQSLKKVKRRVVKKGFYSDEEDGSTEEEVDTRPPLSAFRQPAMLQPGGGHQGMPAVVSSNAGDEDLDVDEDHRLLLRSSLPLLKSRNAAVVMAVCSLHYYCGVSSVKIRSAMGKALVRIHRDRREIQFVVLTSIRTLVQQCPSAFGPFLNDFFVKAMDPPFTRIIKLDILTALALEPVAIEGVLKEFRSYVRSSDKMFVCAAIRAVGKVVELARIVYDRYGTKNGQEVQQRKEANRIALDCLFGLNTLTQASDYVDVVGECALVMQRIILQLMSDASVTPVEDPNGVLGAAIRRIILLLTRSLASRSSTATTDNDPSLEDVEKKAPTELEQVVLPLGPVATASLLWIFGEWVAPIRSSSAVLRVNNMSDKTKSKIKQEVIRLVARSYPELQGFEKEQGIHLASKLLVSTAVNKNTVEKDVKLARSCELVLSMGRVDVNPIVRDRARYESLLLDTTIGLKHDREGLDGATAPPKNKGHPITLDDLNRMLLASKPAPSHLPLDEEDDEDATMGGESATTHFRFGTLSSLVGHKAGAAYLPLPQWAEKNSPTVLRDGSSTPKNNAKTTKSKTTGDDWQVDASKKSAGFYESSEEDDSNDGDEEEDSDDEEEDSDDEDDGDESDDEDSDEDKSDDDEEEDRKQKSNANNSSLLPPVATAPTANHHPFSNGASTSSKAVAAPFVAKTVVESDDDDDDDDSSSEEGSSEEEEDSSDDARPPKPAATTKEGNLLGMMGLSNTTPSINAFMPSSSVSKSNSSATYTSVAEELSGLVMAPLDVREPNLEQDTSAWIQLVRPNVSGGLDLKVRFLRGPSKEQEARRLGLNPEHAGTVCLQVRLENIKSDSTVLRRIRLSQKPSGTSSSSSSSSTIVPRKVVLPNEIASLTPQQVVLEMIGLEFITVTDRDGSCMVKLELKHGSSGGIPIEWKIPLAELLRRNTMTQSLVTVATFDAGMQRLQGFQRVSTTISLPPTVNDDEHDDTTQRQQILRAILAHAALVPVASAATSADADNLYWSSNHQLRLVASLPGSGDPVFVLVTRAPPSSSSTTPSVQLTVCCDSALALNSLVDVLKRAILQSSGGATK